jgi:hypothetical protein
VDHRHPAPESAAGRLLRGLGSPLWLAVVIAVLLVQAYHPLWRRHLEVDVSLRYGVVYEFLRDGSWSNISFTDHPAGAQIYFLLPVALAGGWPVSFPTYSALFVLLSALLLVAHHGIYRRFGPPHAGAVYLLLLVAMGPLQLFRFEPLVALLTLGAWVLFMRGRWRAAGLLFGLAATVKLYPIVLVPLVAAELWRRGRLRPILEYGAAVLAGALLTLVPFVIWSDTPARLLGVPHKYASYPISFETPWGSLLTAGALRTGRAPLPSATVPGITGIDVAASPLPAALHDLLPLIAAALAIAWLLWRFRHAGYREPSIPLVVITAFLVPAKIINPQYLWWPLSFLPLVALPGASALTRALLAAIAASALVLTQLVYPLHFDTFMAWFLGQPVSFGIVALSFARNALLVLFAVLLVVAVGRHVPQKPSSENST